MGIKNYMMILVAFVVFLLLSNSISAIEVGGIANVYSTNNYFWRITPFDVKDPHVQYDFGLSTETGGLAISLSPWVSYNIGLREVNEVDYILNTEYTIGDITANAGAIYYDVVGVAETTEIYGSLGYTKEIADLLSVSPGIKLYYDVDMIKKAYLEASLSLDLPKIPYISFGSILGYDFGQFSLIDENDSIVTESKLTALQISLSGSYELIKGTTISPSFTYVIGLHDSIDNTSFAGLKFGFEF